MWTLVSRATGMVGGLLAQRLMRSAYRAIHNDPTAPSPLDPSSKRFSWPDAVISAAAAGVGLWIAKLLSDRVAAIGWELATGTEPPGWSEAERAGGAG